MVAGVRYWGTSTQQCAPDPQSKKKSRPLQRYSRIFHTIENLAGALKDLFKGKQDWIVSGQDTSFAHPRAHKSFQIHLREVCRAVLCAC